MLQVADAVYCPDLDTRKIPGALIDMYRWAPLANGMYGSSGIADMWTVSGIADLAQTFRSPTGLCRFLVFGIVGGTGVIDEYSSNGTRTNRATGLTASSAWSATSYGNYVIATNYADVIQASTGAAFSALAGSPPKARLIASNINFVMLACTNDGTAYEDEVWWSGLRNPLTWTPSLATQCGRIRLLDTPGQITQLVAFRDKFYAFKENSLYVGEYVGPPAVFQWRVISARVGALGWRNQGVVELDDKLYFAHTTGFYQFDGAQLRNVGSPVWRTILNSVGYGGNPKVDAATGVALTNNRLCADDVEGVVWYMGYNLSGETDYTSFAWGYNARSDKWAAHGAASNTTEELHTWVQTNHSDMRTFLGTAANVLGRVWRINNEATSKLQQLLYPYDWNDAGTLTTGLVGDDNGSTTVTGLHYRIVAPSETVPFASCTFNGYASETKLTGAQSATATVNADLERFDGLQSARYHSATITGTVGKKCVLAGFGFDQAPSAKR